MKRVVIPTLMVLLCASWAIAQQSYPSSQTSNPSSSGQTTIEGCLSRSDGGYTLTDKAGTTYRLSGDTAQLKDHVGHEVQVKGTTTEANQTSSASASGSAATQPNLDVTSLKHISETCSSKSSPESQKAPMSEKPPQ